MSYNDPPVRHRADDDLEALATGSFASKGGDSVSSNSHLGDNTSPIGRTPNGAGDLLDDAFGATEDPFYAKPNPIPSSVGDAGSFSIDDDEDDGGGVASLNSSMRSDGGADLEDPAGGGKDAREAKLAERTSQIMSDYRAYLSEMDANATEGDVLGGGSADDVMNLDIVPTAGGAGMYRDFGAGGVGQGGVGGMGELGGLGSGLEDYGNAPPSSVWRDDVSRVSSLASGGISTAFGLTSRGWTKDVKDVPLDAIDENNYDDLHNSQFDGNGSYGNGKRRRYVHPFFRSKRFKRGCFGIMAATGIIAIAAGVGTAVSHGNKKVKPLPDWHDANHPPDKPFENSGVRGGPVVDVTPLVPSEGLQAPPETNIEEAIPPPPEETVTTTTTTVAATPPPTVAATPPPTVAATPPPTKAPTAKPTLSNEDQFNMDMMYKSISEEFHPMWFDRSTGWLGQTYLSALEFCSKHDSYIPCPYEAYCPAGKGHVPLGGFREDSDGTWSPIINSPNGWVQVGEVGVCTRYADLLGQPPRWGLTGEDNEEETRHIMCCREPSNEIQGGDDADNDNASPSPGADDADDADTTPSDGDGGNSAPAASPGDNLEAPSGSAPQLTGTEQHVLNNLHPIWFKANHGWSGATHLDAIAFCTNINGLHLCPIEAYCPNGPVSVTSTRKPLYLEMDPFEGEQWAPVSNTANSWISIGSEGGPTCETYMQTHKEQPLFGLDGTQVEKKAHVLCCTESFLPQGGQIISSDSNQGSFSPGAVVNTDDSGGTGGQSAPDTPPAENGDTSPAESPADSSAQQPQEAQAVQATPGHVDVEDAVILALHPVWLDQAHGWSGGSHDDAIAFCDMISGMKVCPYAAYCPHGPSKPPMKGHADDFAAHGEQWAPMYGEENHWVQIGEKHENSATTCLSHVQLEGNKPDWGLDGTETQMKTYIMCCKLDN